MDQKEELKEFQKKLDRIVLSSLWSDQERTGLLEKIAPMLNVVLSIIVLIIIMLKK